MENNKEEKQLKAFGEGILAGVLVVSSAILVANYIGSTTDLSVPKTQRVESGYVIPSKLEIDCQDLDGNGTPETILKYEGKTYLFMYLGQQPLITPYEVRPAQVIPAQIILK